jgi:serine phosphatase RsbU (regulator of sigma subunit)
LLAAPVIEAGRTLFLEYEAPEALLRLDASIARMYMGTDGFYVGLAAVVLNPHEHTLSIFPAGFGGILYWQPKNCKVTRAIPSGAGNPMLGFELETINFAGYRLTLEPGDGLILFTDGVDEARPQSFDLFGQKRLQQLILDAGDISAQKLGELIVDTVKKHTASPQLADDMAIVIVRRSS